MDKQVWAEVVTVGSELVLGQLIDTNAAFLASALSEIGIGLAYHTSVGDDPVRMAEVFRTALSRADVVVTTGGIGPTEDDLTREVAAEVTGRPLVMRQDLLDFIESLFKRIGYHMAENNKRQAYIPEGADVIHNPHGTAPAFRIEQDGHVLICLPGVPRETEPLVRDEVLPFLKQRFNPGGRLWVNRVLKVCGVGESNVDAQIKEIIRSSKNPFIGLQASPGEIKVRLTAMGSDAAETTRLLDEGEKRIREKIGDLIFGYGEDTLPGAIARLLEERGLSLAVGEALTRGVAAADLARRLPAGRFRGALILEDLVSAEDLADRLAREFDADLILAVTGPPADEEGKIRLDILIRGRDGKEGRRTQDLGGPPRLIVERSATIAQFTLFQYLNRGEV